MKFPSLPVTSHQGATLNFDRLQQELNVPWKPVLALGYEHGWKELEAGRLPEYRKDILGNVELQGIVSAGESGKSAFTLPVGYRPLTVRKAFIVQANGNTGIITVESTGVVVPLNLGGEVTVYTYLDAVRFSVT